MTLNHAQQVAQGQQQQQTPPSFIQDLAVQISSVTELLSSLKSQQRQQYSSLLQQEQRLLVEIDQLQLNLGSCSDNSQGSLQNDPYGNSSDYLQDSFGAAPDAIGAAKKPSSTSKLHENSSGTTAATVNSSSCTSKPAVAPHTTGAATSCQTPAAGTSCSWADSSSSTTSSTTPRALSACRNSTLLPEVLAYDDFTSHHGATGGWHPDDHNTFLTVLRRSRCAAGWAVQQAYI